MFPFAHFSQDTLPSNQERKKSTLLLVLRNSIDVGACYKEFTYTFVCICVFSKGCFKIWPARENIAEGSLTLPHSLIILTPIGAFQILT